MTGVPHIEGRWWGSTSASVAAHAALFALMMLMAVRVTNLSDPPHLLSAGALVFVPESGSGRGGGGGGGGGDTVAQSLRPALMKRATPPSIPSSPSETIQPPASPPTIVATGVDTMPGAVTPIDSFGTAAGKWDGPGGGDGRGGGNGPGDGTGLGAGKVAGFGGDVYLPGNGVSNPVLVREVKPNYTADALRAKIQGTVEMEAVVRVDGTIDPRSIRIVRSLDSTFGLDREAIEAVKQWRFRPAMRTGQAVASFVTLELVFTLR
jgi:TonB family protein